MTPTALILLTVLGAGSARAQNELASAYGAALSGVRSGNVAGQAVPALPPSAPAAPPEIPSFPVSEALAKVLAGLPATDIGKKGHPGAPLALVFIGTRDEIRSALKRARWTDVPRGTAAAFLKGLGELATGRRIDKFPPFHKYRVEGRTQDENWAQVVQSISKRHHFRLWKLKEADPAGRAIWWGSASYDTGIRWKFIFPVTHNTDPDLAVERDYIARTLMAAPGVARVGLAVLPQIPLGGINNQKDHYFTDGRALVVEFGAASPREDSPYDAASEIESD